MRIRERRSNGQMVGIFLDDQRDPAQRVTDTPPPTPRVGVLWQPVDTASLYASYTSNYGDTALGALKGEARTAFDGLECRVVGPWEEKPA